MDRIIGTEEEIRQYSAEMEIALESIDLHTNNLFRIEYILENVKKNGVSRIAMETIYSIYPEAIPENSRPYMFTIESSDVNMEYALEGFFEAIGTAIKWIFTQILEALKAIFNMFVSFINWLLNKEEKKKKSSGWNNEYLEKLERERQEVLNEYQESINKLNSLPEDKKRNIDTKKIENFEIEFRNKYLTELDYLIIIQSDGYDGENLLNVAKLLSEHLNSAYSKYSIAIKAYSDIIKDRKVGVDATNLISTMKTMLFSDIEGLEGKPYFALPFSFGILEELFNTSNITIPSHVKAKFSKDPNYKKTIDLIYTDKQSEDADAFWGPARPGIKGQRPDPDSLTKKWGKDKDTSLFYHPYYDNSIRIRNIKLDELKVLSSINVSSLKRDMDDIEKNLNKIKDDLEDLYKNIDKYVSAYFHDIGFIPDKKNVFIEDLEKWDGDSHPFMVVWPIKGGGKYKTGNIIFNDSIPSDSKKNVEAWKKKAKNEIENIKPVVINAFIPMFYESSMAMPFWTNMRRPVRYLIGGMSDILTTIGRYNEINEFILKDTDAKKKVIEQIKKAHEKYEKENQ